MKRRNLLVISVGVACTFAVELPADTIEVPADYPTIQAAVNVALNSDEIVVAPGTYSESIDLLGKLITLRSSGGPKVTFLDGSGLDSSIVVCNSGESLATVVEGFTLANGGGFETLFNCIQPFQKVGGAIYVADSGITVIDCTFLSNGSETLVGGGAIYVQNGELTISDCRFTDNNAPTGGGVYLCNSSQLVASGTVFECNGADFGGAISVDFPELVTITGCTFASNVASAGGGAIRMGPSGASSADISQCTFTDNSAGTGGGINVSVSDDAIVDITDCTFSGGSAAFGGGAHLTVAGPGAATLSLSNSRFLDNEAGFGGGLVAVTADGGSIDVTRCDFSTNVAHACCNTGIWSTGCFVDGANNGLYWGGGADLRTFSSGNIEVTNCLFDGNEAIRAGGLHLMACGGGRIDLVNSTIVSSSPSGLHLRLGSRGGFPGGVITVSNSIVRGIAGPEPLEILLQDAGVSAQVTYCNIEGGFDGVGNVDNDPMFVDPLGGDYRLAPGSMSIDAGDNTAVPVGVVNDLDGNPRFVDDPGTPDTGNPDGINPIVDMGAYEHQGPSTCAADCGVVDGEVGIADFLALLSQWGFPGKCDVDGGGVGITDLLALLASWGPCS